MTTYDPVIHDLQRTVDELRTLLHSAVQDRQDWQDLAERAIAQIEEWRTLCDEWQNRYNQLLGAN
jgi:FtsZ-binding cell division protein ZapB